MHKSVWRSSIWFTVSIVCFNWLCILLGWILIMPRLLNMRRCDDQFLGVWTISSIFTKGNLLLYIMQSWILVIVRETFMCLFCFWTLDSIFPLVLKSRYLKLCNSHYISKQRLWQCRHELWKLSFIHIQKQEKSSDIGDVYVYCIHGFTIMIFVNSSIGG